MIVQRKTKGELLLGLFNAKNFLIGLMAATFLVFASGADVTPQNGDLATIMIGATLFTLASGLLIWARDISKSFYN